MTSSPSAALQTIALWLVATTACGITAQQAGKRAGKGAAAALAEETQKLEPSEAGPAFERAGRGVTKGIVAQLEQPEQLAQLQLVAREASAAALRGIASAGGPERDGVIASISDQAARSAAQAVASELGPDGDGPLARSLYATAERVSASAMRGVRGEARMFPECAGIDRQKCIDQRLEGMSRAAAVGVREGLRGLFALPALLLAFLVGVGSALAVSWVWSHHRHASVG